MSELKTPGVYIKEKMKLPPFLSEGDTAIPAFIGYTENIPLIPIQRITSMLEYEAVFGKAYPEQITLRETVNEGLILEKPEAKFLMYYSLQMYFANGGGPCYIVSVGDYNDEVKYEVFPDAITLVKELDEPTLIVFPDAISLNENEFYKIYNQALDMATNKKDRFVLIDTYRGDSITTTGPGPDNLNTVAYFRLNVNPSNYGAVYFPHLKTVLNYTFNETTPISHTGLQQSSQTSSDFYESEINALKELKALAQDEISGSDTNAYVLADLLTQAIAIAEEVNETADLKEPLSEAIEEAKQVLNSINDGTIDSFDLSFTNEFEDLKTAILHVEDKRGDADGKNLQQLKTMNSALYNQIKDTIASSSVILPPSSAMAGIYARVDGTKGVWKAPANIAFNYVTGITEKVSDLEQEGLNVHSEGKSINVIRNFTGKGTVVWGARTYNSEEDDWRYIQVRRFFDMVEKSVKKATKKFIGRPNDDFTWLTAKAMIENYLNRLWKDGALAGSTPEEAYYVIVEPLGNASDGKMRVEIGMAIVRPAEFITLNFSHKLQKS
jgi:uncharacterized protein